MSKKQTVNTPLTRAQVKALPRRRQEFVVNAKGHLELSTIHDGFTPTSIGITGQGLKRLNKNPHPKTNRKHTPGRKVQEIPIYAKDEAGNKVIAFRRNARGYTEEYSPVIGVKHIWHRSPRRMMNL